MEPFENVSPLDARYIAPDPAMRERIEPYLSEAASIRYQLRVEIALLQALADLGVCPPSVPEAAEVAAADITAAEVFEEERRIGHNIRALVNCLRERLTEEERGYVHLFATSNDILDTCRTLAFREFGEKVLIPDLIGLLDVIIEKAREYASLRQIGRTHGQFATPITFGYSLAVYVNRLGKRIVSLERARNSLKGKFSGAVGAHSTYSLRDPEDPGALERKVLEKMGLEPSATQTSTQVVDPEPIGDLMFQSLLCLSIMADIADDMRHLIRSEIGEVVIGSPGGTRIGSSTMPHKVNPVSFENVKSIWKAFAPRIVTVLMDQLSEHQRDLTNSASGRFLNEILAATDYTAVRLSKALGKIRANITNLERNLEAGKHHIVAEPLYIILALGGHPDAYDCVRSLLRQAQEEGITLIEAARQDPEAGEILRNLPEHQAEIIQDPTAYTGDATDRTLLTCDMWEKRLAPLRGRASSS